MSKRRPALKVHGSKFRFAPWILSHAPEHQSYVEPCFGSGSVLLRKAPVKVETVNDSNGEIVNFFKVLRDNKEELIRVINLTPYAEDEFKLSKQPVDDPIESARRLFIRSWGSFEGLHKPTTLRTQKNANGRFSTPPKDLINHDLLFIAERLRNVQILNRDMLQVIKKYSMGEGTLTYFDPPYVQMTRTAVSFYGANDFTDQDHIDASKLLKQSKGYVIISGYESPLYHELYNGWAVVKKQSQTNASSYRVECLYLSPSVVESNLGVSYG